MSNSRQILSRRGAKTKSRGDIFLLVQDRRVSFTLRSIHLSGRVHCLHIIIKIHLSRPFYRPGKLCCKPNHKLKIKSVKVKKSFEQISEN